MDEFKLTCTPVGHDWWGKNCDLITQKFGENSNNWYQQWGLLGHDGIDYRTLNWQDAHAPVFAAHDGYVVSDKLVQNDRDGRYVQLMSDETTINGKPCKVLTLYFHLSSARVGVWDLITSPWFWLKPGQRFVRAGQLIGYSGNTGIYTTGPHLHFGMHVLWKQADGTFQMDLNNGYQGAVDPMLFQQDNTVYQYGTFGERQWFYNGKAVQQTDLAKLIIPIDGF